MAAVAHLGIGDEREHGHENGRGRPEEHAAGVEELLGGELAQLVVAHLVDLGQEVRLPRVVLDHTDAL